MKIPTISIIIPTYNRASTIGRTINSFISQDYQDWEMLIIDDHSTDNTKELIDQYHQNDLRIHYILNEHKKGAQGARNTGILHAKSDWVILFDSDDTAYPYFLNRMVAEIDNQTDVVTCYARKVWTDGSKVEIKQWGAEGYIEELLYKGWCYIGFDCGICRKSKLLSIGLLDEDCPCLQEFDTHLRLSQICTYKQIKEPLVEYTWGGMDTISKANGKEYNGRFYVLWHNQKRWKVVDYKSFYATARGLFFNVSLRKKLLLVTMCPKILLRLPRMLIGNLKRRVLKQQ